MWRKSHHIFSVNHTQKHYLLTFVFNFLQYQNRMLYTANITTFFIYKQMIPSCALSNPFAARSRETTQDKCSCHGSNEALQKVGQNYPADIRSGTCSKQF